MSNLPLPTADLDRDAIARMPSRFAAHLLGLGLVVSVLVALPVAPTDLDRHQFPKESVAHLMVWLATLLARPTTSRLPGRALRLGLMLFLGATVVSAALAPNPWLAGRAASLTLTLLAAFITGRHLAHQGHGAILMRWGLIAGLLGGLSGLVQAQGVRSALFAPLRVPGGTFGNRNFLAHYLALTIPLATGTVLLTRRRRDLLLALVVLALAAGMILLTRSRAAWLGAGCGVLCCALVLWRARGHGLRLPGGRLAALGVAPALGLLLATATPNMLTWVSDSPYRDTLTGLLNYQDGSGRGRMLQFRHSLTLVRSHPVLGVGPGNWPIRYAAVSPPGDPSWIAGDVIPLNPWPSSDWVALLSERGPLAVLGLVLAGLALAMRSWRTTRIGGDRAIAGGALLALLATLLVEGSFDAVALLAAPGLLIAVAAGVLLTRVEGDVTTEPDRQPMAHHGYRLAVLLLGLATLRSLQQTTAYLVAGEGKDRSRLTLAARIDPGSYALRMALARTGSCRDARAAQRLAPDWPAPRQALRRCGSSDD